MIRRRPKDDRELEQMAEIKPADHGFVSPAAIQQAERKMLGAWGKKRRKYRPL
jgi:hypothetical protein